KRRNPGTPNPIFERGYSCFLFGCFLLLIVSGEQTVELGFFSGNDGEKFGSRFRAADRLSGKLVNETWCPKFACGSGVLHCFLLNSCLQVFPAPNNFFQVPSLQRVTPHNVQHCKAAELKRSDATPTVDFV